VELVAGVVLVGVYEPTYNTVSAFFTSRQQNKENSYLCEATRDQIPVFEFLSKLHEVAEGAERVSSITLRRYPR
jgi:hypothetical protein